MVKDYRDVNTLDTEDDGDEDLKRVPTEFAPPWGRRVYSGRRLIFVMLGLLCILAILTVVFGFTGSSFRTDLLTMEKNLQNVNQTIFGALATLKEKESSDVKRLVKVDQIIKNLTEEVKEAKTQFEEHISKLRASTHLLNCRLEDIKHNRTGSTTLCCPKGWLSFRQSCYWFSTSEKTWDEAKADCENKDSRLVIITSYQEQAFVAQHTKPRNTWIGLRFTNERWTWVDATLYTIRRIDWRPRRPNNYSYHMPGEPANCAHLYRDGLWSDEHCMRPYNWVCEVEKKA
ncbi:asialoglycoprotein receptor 1 [Pogona vitticeps]